MRRKSMEKTEDKWCFAGRPLKAWMNLAVLEVGQHFVYFSTLHFLGVKWDLYLWFTCLFCASLPTCALLAFTKVDTGLFCQEKLVVTCTISKSKMGYFEAASQGVRCSLWLVGALCCHLAQTWNRPASLCCWASSLWFSMPTLPKLLT